MMSLKNLYLLQFNLNTKTFFSKNVNYDFTRKLIHAINCKFFHYNFAGKSPLLLCNAKSQGIKNIQTKTLTVNKFQYRKNKILSHSIFSTLSTLSVNKKDKFLKNTFIPSVITATPKWIEFSVYNKNEITFYVFPEYIFPILFYLKNHINTQFKMLLDVTAVDYPSRVSRFQVVYHLLSISYNARIRIKTCVNEINALSSVTKLYSYDGWWEREVCDMFGIFFSGHPDLRRILTDYGFQGHPLRKDFPLSGFVEVRYDDSEKRVITEPVEMTQEFRYFDFASPWEQIEKI